MNNASNRSHQNNLSLKMLSGCVYNSKPGTAVNYLTTVFQIQFLLIHLSPNSQTIYRKAKIGSNVR